MLCNASSFKDVIGKRHSEYSDHQLLPFLCSVLNRHNRVPANGGTSHLSILFRINYPLLYSIVVMRCSEFLLLDFSDDPRALRCLIEALERHSSRDHSIQGLMHRRIPKYVSLIGSQEVPKVPAMTRPFFENEDTHMQVMVRCHKLLSARQNRHSMLLEAE